MPQHILSQLAIFLRQRAPVALATVTSTRGSSPRKLGARMLLTGDGIQIGTIGGGVVEFQVLEQAREALRTGVATTFRTDLAQDSAMCCGGSMEVIVEPFLPKPRVLIFGAGHVAEAVGAVAAVAGFELVVVDERGEWASPERFPEAELHVSDPLDIWEDLPWGDDLIALIITHAHELDQAILRRALGESWRYLGMIGSRAKVRRFQRRLLARGCDPVRLAEVHMPIGLTLGNNEPGQIAVSVVAELLCALGHGSGEHRRLNLPAGFSPASEG